MTKHGQGEALPETARTDEEEVAVGILHLLDEAGLVHVVAVVLAEADEVHYPVRDAFTACSFVHGILSFPQR